MVGRALLGFLAGACLLLLLGGKCAPTAVMPPLVASVPAAGASAVPTTEWIRLDFGAAFGRLPVFRLHCGGVQLTVWPTPLDGDRLVLNPAPDMPPGAACDLTWPGPGGTETLSFSTGPAWTFPVKYNRSDPRTTTPFPDDFWLVDDPSTRTGKRVQIGIPAFPPGDSLNLATGLVAVPNTLDGFSPVAPLVVQYGLSPTLSSLPTDAAASLDPVGTIGLFDLTPGSPTRGERVPFVLGPLGWLILPGVPLQPEGRYGLVVTRRVRSGNSTAAPSPSFAAALADPQAGEDPSITRTRELALGVLDEIAAHGTLAYLPEDVALVLSITVRSVADLPDDIVAMRNQLLAAAPPAFQVDTVDPSPIPGVAALVQGTWELPNYLMTAPDFLMNRDASGTPLQNGTRSVGFTLALPEASVAAPAPIVMHQHGSPGCAEEEVPRVAGLRGESQTLAEAGFAVVGFTDVVNRRILNPGGPPCALDLGTSLTLQFQVYIFSILAFLQPPDYQRVTAAEQIAFLRLIESLGSLDCLPLNAGCDAGDGAPELDPDAPLSYLGVSMGSNHAPGFLPYAPEIAASVLTVGGGRFLDWAYHQNPSGLLSSVAGFFPELTTMEALWGLSVFQSAFDGQETALHAPFLYRDPVDLGAAGARTSVLLTEGIGDTIQPNHATRSLAWALGPLPHLEPVHEDTVVLDSAPSPVQANVDAGTTAAFQQWVPEGIPGLAPTPGCESQGEGHYCAQSAWPAVEQWIRFLRSAQSGPAPVIEDPLQP